MALETIPMVPLQVARNVVQLVLGKITIASLLITLTMVWILFVYFISSSPQLFKEEKPSSM
jgi:hypothetical protein